MLPVYVTIRKWLNKRNLLILKFNFSLEIYECPAAYLGRPGDLTLPEDLDFAGDFLERGASSSAKILFLTPLADNRPGDFLTLFRSELMSDSLLYFIFIILHIFIKKYISVYILHL